MWNELGAVRLGGSPSIQSTKILNFLTAATRQIKFSEWVDIKNKLNLKKMGAQQYSNFLTFYTRHIKFLR